MRNKEEVKDYLLNQLKSQIDNMYIEVQDEKSLGILDPNDTHDPEDMSFQDESNLMEDIYQRKMSEKKLEYNVFSNISFDPKSRIEPGAIVKTQRTTFVIGMASLPFDWEGERWMAISTKSPLYKEMHGRKVGENFTFLNQEFIIENIY